MVSIYKGKGARMECLSVPGRVFAHSCWRAWNHCWLNVIGRNNLASLRGVLRQMQSLHCACCQTYTVNLASPCM